MFWPVTVLQGSARSLYSVQVDASSNIGVFLSAVGKCRNAKVNNELTCFLLNWRNPRQKLFNYWLRLTVKIACLVHACLNGTNDFRKAEKAWKMMIAQAVHAQPLPMTTLKKCEMCVIRKDRRLGVRAVAEVVNLYRESVRRILGEELNMRKVCAKMVLQLLSDEQKRTSQGIVFVPFATHWEWTTFVELGNYLWWNLGIYVLSGN